MGKKHLKRSDELDSWVRIVKDYNWGRYFNCAAVFFANNKWELDSKDKLELATIREKFRRLLDNHFWIFLDTHGTASSPGSDRYNRNLSMKRSNEVLNFFKNELNHYTRFICGREFTGEDFSRPERRFHSVDRKVIVSVKIAMGRDPNSPFQGYERAYISRVKIFMRYNPHYHLWRERGLFYLVEQYEKLYEENKEDNLKINEKDLDKVIDLLMKRFPPEIKNPFLNDLKYGNHAEVVTEYYHLLYRHDYNVAYDRYNQVNDANILADILSQKY